MLRIELVDELKRFQGRVLKKVFEDLAKSRTEIIRSHVPIEEPMHITKTSSGLIGRYVTTLNTRKSRGVICRDGCYAVAPWCEPKTYWTQRHARIELDSLRAKPLSGPPRIRMSFFSGCSTKPVTNFTELQQVTSGKPHVIQSDEEMFEATVLRA